MNDAKDAVRVRAQCAWWLSGQCAGNAKCWCRPKVEIPEPVHVPEPRDTAR